MESDYCGHSLPDYDDDDDDDDGGNYGAIAIAEEREKGLENMAVANDTPDRDPLR